MASSPTRARAPHMLFVTGARALDPDFARDPGSMAACAMARNVLACAVSALPAGSWLMTGRCPYGPDRWAEDLARASRPDVRRVGYDVDGDRYVQDVRYDRWAKTAGSQDPLARNDAMIDAATALEWTGGTVEVLGITGEDRAARGTDYTLAHAQLANLTVTRFVVPRATARVPTGHHVPPTPCVLPVAHRVPTPGSVAAVAQGCACPGLDYAPASGWWYVVQGCPRHGAMVTPGVASPGEATRAATGPCSAVEGTVGVALRASVEGPSR